MSSPKVIFLPWDEVDPSNTERTPKLLHLISQWYPVVPVRPGRLNQTVYDQKVDRTARYLLFTLDEFNIFLTTLRAARREDVSLIFAEGSYFSLAGGMAARIRGIPLVWDIHSNIRDLSTALNKSPLFFRANMFLERLLHRLATAVLVVSEREREVYGEMGFPGDKFEVIPTCADLSMLDPALLPREEARSRLGIPLDTPMILFFGTLNYRPNLESAQYIIEDMMPAVRAQVPGAVAFLAGSGELGMAPPEGVHMLGFVPDLGVWLSATDVCIAPIWKGVGILTKVIDMLSAGRATVVSPLALEGIPELADGYNCLVGRDPSHFAEQVIRLLSDAELRGRLEREGRQLVEEQYCWEKMGPRLNDLLDRIIDSPTVHPPSSRENRRGVKDG